VSHANSYKVISMKICRAMMGVAFIILSATDVMASPSWTPIGPFGGPINQVVFDPGKMGVIYAATASNGVFVSNDYGASWQPANNGFTSGIDINQLSFDPNTPGRIYAATATGLYRTDNDGTLWVLIGNPIDVYSVSVDPINSLHLYRTDASGLVESNDGGTTFTPLAVNACREVEFNPAVKGVVYCFGIGSGIQRSTDNGKTWENVTPGAGSNVIGDMPIWVAKSNPEIVYTVGLDGAYRSSDSGATWVSITPASGHSGPLAVDPNDANVIYMLAWGRILKSVDGGLSWRTGTYNPTLLVSPFPANPLAIDPQYPWHLLLGEFASWDSGADFFESNTGLTASDAYAVTGDSGNPPRIIVGTGEHLYEGIDGGALWKKMDNCRASLGGILQLASDHGNSGYVYAVGNYPVGGNFGELLPGQTNWQCQNSVGASEIVPSPTQSGFAYLEQTDSFGGFNYIYSTSNFGFNWSLVKTTSDLGEHPGIAVSYLTPGLVYTDEDNDIYKTTDGGQHWSEQTGQPFVGTFPHAFAISAASDDILLATNGANIERSGDAGASWSNVFSPSTGETTNGLFVDEDTPGIDYVLLSDGLMESKDDGLSWTAPDYSGLSGHTVHSMFHSTAYPQYFYASTGDAGTFSLTEPTDLTLNLSGLNGENIPIGGSGNYSIQVTNNSNVAASHIWLSIVVPSSFVVSNLSTAGGICRWAPAVYNSPRLLCNYPQLATASTWNVSFTGTPTASGPGSIYASVASSEGDNNWTDNAGYRYFVAGDATDLGVTISPSTGISASAFGKLFTINVTNQGMTGDNAQVLIGITPTLSSLQATSSNGVCGVSAGLIQCQENAISPGSSTSILISGVAGNTAVVRAWASITALSATDIKPTNNYAIGSIQMGQQANVLAGKLGFLSQNHGKVQTDSYGGKVQTDPSKGTAGSGAFSFLSILLLLAMELFQHGYKLMRSRRID
jgi:photosystem II stability/assembly factor-like uncharacterized protein